MPDELVTLMLPRNFVGQMLDGLCCREQSYRDTAEYLEHGVTPDPGSTFIIEEVKDAEEARTLAGFYREVIEEVDGQLHAICDNVQTVEHRVWRMCNIFDAVEMQPMIDHNGLQEHCDPEEANAWYFALHYSRPEDRDVRGATVAIADFTDRTLCQTKGEALAGLLGIDFVNYASQ